MSLINSELKAIRPNTSKPQNSPDPYLCTAVDWIYFNETSEFSPNRRIPQLSKASLRSYSSSKYSHRKANSDFSSIGPITKFQLLTSKDFSVQDILKDLKPKRPYIKNLNTRLRTPSKDIEAKRNLRCTAINHLLTACEKVKDSKQLNKAIDSEKNIVRTWVKAVDKVESDLKSIDEANADIVQHLYYFNKFSNDEIFKEIRKLKSKAGMGWSKSGHSRKGGVH